MKAIFLDIDGVLNSNEHTAFIKSFITYGDNMIEPFDDECLYNLKYIVDETDAKIIITSIWRLFPDYLYILMNKLEEYDLDKDVISLTISNKYKDKLQEIAVKLKKLGITEYVVLDNDDTLKLDRHIITNNATGLTEIDAKQAVKILSFNEEMSRKYNR